MALPPFPFLTVGPERVQVDFRFQINGTSDPDNVVATAGLIDDITRDSIGVFTVTLSKYFRFTDLITCHASVAGDLTDDAKYVSWDPDTGALVLNTVLQDGTQAVDDPADDSWVHVTAVFCRRQNMNPTLSV